MEKVFLAVSIATICIMVYALFSVIRLNKRIPGGTVGSTWKVLSILLGIFTGGYIATAFFPLIPSVYKLIVGVIFLTAAFFIVIVINLFQNIIKEVGL